MFQKILTGEPNVEPSEADPTAAAIALLPLLLLPAAAHHIKPDTSLAVVPVPVAPVEAPNRASFGRRRSRTSSCPIQTVPRLPVRTRACRPG